MRVGTVEDAWVAKMLGCMGKIKKDVIGDNMIPNNSPIKLNYPRAWRTYTGGANLNILHNEKPEVTNFPEEWIMSMVSARNSGRESIKDEGLSKLVDYDEKYLKDIIDENAVYYLGEEHVRKYDGQNGLGRTSL